MSTSRGTGASSFITTCSTAFCFRAEETEQVLQHLADLWGYGVVLKEIDPSTGAVLKEHTARARAPFC